MKACGIFLTVFLLLSTTVYAQSSGIAQPEAKSKTSTGTENQQATNNQAFVDKIPTSETAKKSSTDDQGKTHVKTPDERIADFTLWLVIVAAIQAAIFIAQLIAMSIQAKRLRETVKATEKTAEAARKSAEALPATERAYLFIDIDLEPRYNYVKITLSLRNKGKTPAIVTSIYADLIIGAICPDNTNNALNIPITEVSIVGAGAVENKKLDFDWYKLTGQQRVDEIETDLIFYGIINYKDVFKENHTTRFCWHHDARAINEGVYFRLCGNDKANCYT